MECLSRRVELRFAFGVDLGRMEVELFNGVGQDAADESATGVFVVGRHHIPWGPPGRGGSHHRLVGVAILVEVGALRDIGGREFPVFVGVVEAGQKSALLLVFGDVQEDLDDPGAVAVEVALEGVDVLVALMPQLLTGDRAGWEVLAPRGWRDGRG